MRYISVLLSLLLLVSALVLPVSATAAETVEFFVTLEGDGLAEAAMAVGSAAEYAATEAGAAAIAQAQAQLARMAEAIERLPGAEVLGQNWFLSLALVVRLPESQLRALVALDGVASLERISTHAAMNEDAVAEEAEETDEAPNADMGTVIVAEPNPEPFYAPDLLGIEELQAGGVLGEGVLARGD